MAGAPQHALDRIANAMANNKAKRINYIEQDRGGASAAFCKLCGTKVCGLIVDDRFREHKTIKGKIVIFERLRYVNLPAYQEVHVEMDDGSSHSTFLCKNCASSDLDDEQLEGVYAGDLQEWINDSGPLPKNDSSIWSRKPVKLVPVR